MQREDEKNDRLADKFIALMILLGPILIYYDAPFLVSSMATLIQFVLLGTLAIRSAIQKRIIIDSSSIWLVAFLAWVCIVTAFSLLTEYGRGYSSKNAFVAFTLYILIVFIYCCLGNFSFKCLQRYYRSFCFVIVILYVIQVLSYYILGKVMVYKIPFLNLNTVYMDNFGTSVSSYAKVAQFSCLFSEKSHFSQYLMPYLVMNLFTDDVKQSKQRVMHAVILSIVLLSTASGIGIIGTLIVWMIFLFSGKTGKLSVRKKILIFIFGGIFIIITHKILLENVPLYEQTISRLFTSSSGYSKSDYRINRGWYSFKNLGILPQMVGIGYRQFSRYSIINGIKEIYGASSNTEYFSAMFQVLIYFGAIGLVMVVLFYWKRSKSLQTTGKAILLIYFAIAFAASVFFDATAVMYLALACSYRSSKTQGRFDSKNTKHLLW